MKRKHKAYDKATLVFYKDVWSRMWIGDEDIRYVIVPPLTRKIRDVKFKSYTEAVVALTEEKLGLAHVNLWHIPNSDFPNFPRVGIHKDWKPLKLIRRQWSPGRGTTVTTTMIGDSG